VYEHVCECMNEYVNERKRAQEQENREPAHASDGKHSLDFMFLLLPLGIECLLNGLGTIAVSFEGTVLAHHAIAHEGITSVVRILRGQILPLLHYTPPTEKRMRLRLRESPRPEPN
jgi:hypothetical protein